MGYEQSIVRSGHLIRAVLLLAASTLVGSGAAPVASSERAAHERTAFAKPSFPSGGIINLTYKSSVDGSLQPLLAKLPSGYRPERKWPLLVTLHGFGAGPLLAMEVDSMVQIGPFGRGSVQFSGIGERDVFDAIEVAGRLFSVDPNRLYLCGFSMGASAVFDLAFRYPDRWAACVPVCGGWSDLDMVINARQVPFWIHAGGRDSVVPPARLRAVFEKAVELGYSEWRYTEHAELEHDFAINWPEVEQWLLARKIVAHPEEVSLCVRSLHSSRAYWTQILGMRDCGRPAFIEARVTGQTVEIKTENVLGYMLLPGPGLMDVTREMRVMEAGEEIFRGLLNEDGRFLRDAHPGGVRKRPGLSGPLWDVYSDTCVLVYGTASEDPSLVRAARECARSFADPLWMDKVMFHIAGDKDIADTALQENNIVLFGNAELNAVLARIDDRLPIHMAGNQILAGDQVYDAPRGGYVLIYPNPLNPARYAAVFAGNSAEAINCFVSIWPAFTSVPRDIDFGVFQLPAGGGAVTWLATGMFDTNWRLPDLRAARR